METTTPRLSMTPTIFIASMLAVIGLVCMILGYPENYPWQSALVQVAVLCWAGAAAVGIRFPYQVRQLHRDQSLKWRVIRMVFPVLAGLGILVIVGAFLLRAPSIAAMGQLLVWLGVLTFGIGVMGTRAPNAPRTTYGPEPRAAGEQLDFELGNSLIFGLVKKPGETGGLPRVEQPVIAYDEMRDGPQISARPWQRGPEGFDAGPQTQPFNPGFEQPQTQGFDRPTGGFDRPTGGFDRPTGGFERQPDFDRGAPHDPLYRPTDFRSGAEPYAPGGPANTGPHRRPDFAAAPEARAVAPQQHVSQSRPSMSSPIPLDRPAANQWGAQPPPSQSLEWLYGEAAGQTHGPETTGSGMNPTPRPTNPFQPSAVPLDGPTPSSSATPHRHVGPRDGAGAPAEQMRRRPPVTDGPAYPVDRDSAAPRPYPGLGETLPPPRPDVAPQLHVVEPAAPDTQLPTTQPGKPRRALSGD